MKHQKLSLIAFFLAMVLTATAAAQQPDRLKRPVKNPPQFPNIIDLENKDTPPSPRPEQTANPQSEAGATTLQAEPFVQVLASLASELRTLSRELRSMNLRQQAQLDILRMTRVDLRIDHYEQQVRSVREKITPLETEEQQLFQAMTRESLLAQTANMGTLNRDQTMEQIKRNYENRLRFVQAEKERLRKIESDLLSSMKIYQNLGAETEQRMQATEEMLRRMETGQGIAEPDRTGRKP